MASTAQRRDVLHAYQWGRLKFMTVHPKIQYRPPPEKTARINSTDLPIADYIGGFIWKSAEIFSLLNPTIQIDTIWITNKGKCFVLFLFLIV